MAKNKVSQRLGSVVLSVIHIYILSLLSEVSRFRSEFKEKAIQDGFDQFIDVTNEDPFAIELRYLSDNGYVMTENIKVSASGAKVKKLYVLTERGSKAIGTAFTAYSLIVKQLSRQ